MRCLLIVLVVQGVVSLQLGVVHLRQPAPSRAHVVLSEVLVLANDASAVTASPHTKWVCVHRIRSSLRRSAS